MNVCENILTKGEISAFLRNIKPDKENCFAIHVLFNPVPHNLDF